MLTDKPITLGRETGDGRYGVPPANAEVKADRFIELKPLQPALPAKESVVVGDRLSLIHRAMPAPVVSDARALGRAQDASTTSTKAAVSKPGGEAGKLIEVPGNPPLLGPAGAADAARPAAKLLAQVAALDAQDRRPAADPASPPQRFPFTVQDRGGDAGKQSGRLTTPRQAARTAEKASELGVQPAAVPASVTGGGKVSTPSKLEDVLLARAETRPGAANAAPSPAVLLAPAEQILSHVSGEAPGLTGKTHHSGAGFLADAGPGGRTGMTVLRLRLQPETLGDVEVTLRRRSTDVVVHISVNSEETARTLQQDVALLQDRLGLALSGEAVAAVQISVRDQPAQTPNQPMAGSGQSSGFAAPSGGEPGSDRRPPPGTNEHLFAPEKSDDDKEAGRTGNRDTGLVV
ncbi:MAG: flagellar hook-length control protein FliK [Aestuariivirga sp.]|uniref:flagellar hook-length control protein FliK n=1 Tax=Aestuariivirga sp. TaxID=2650926 RepID=UPI0038CF39D6